MKVQTEVGRCVASLAVKREEVCGVLARLETVTAMVRAVEMSMLDRNKKTENKKSFPDPVLKTDLDYNYNSLVTAESKDSVFAFTSALSFSWKSK